MATAPQRITNFTPSQQNLNMETLTLEPSRLIGSAELIEKDSDQRIENRNKLYYPAYLLPMQELTGLRSTSPLEFGVVVKHPEQGSVLVNTCSKNYGLVLIENILTPLEAELDRNFKYKASYRHSEDLTKFYIDYTFEAPEGVKLDVGDIIPKIRIVHSYSGDLKFSVEFGFYRLICSNGMTVPGKTVNKLNTKHVKHGLAETIQAALEGIEWFVDNAGSFVKKYNELAHKPCADFSDRLDKVVAATGYPKGLKVEAANRAAKEIREGVAKTDWLVYNALNYPLNHNYTTFNMQEYNRMALDEKVMDWLTLN